jgi:hypothetical protein
MCSLCFENNLLTIEGVRFASISKKTPLLKLSFAFVSLALPLLYCTIWPLAAQRKRTQTRSARSTKCRNVRITVFLLSLFTLLETSVSEQQDKDARYKVRKKTVAEFIDPLRELKPA